MTQPDSAVDFLRFFLQWDDQSKYGSSVSGRLQDFVRNSLYPSTSGALLRMKQEGKTASLRTLVDLVQLDRSRPFHKRVLQDPAFWRPNKATIRPARVRALSMVNQTGIDLDLRQTNFSELRGNLLGDSKETSGPFSRFFREHAEAAQALKFQRRKLRTRRKFQDPLFVGHACITWSDGTLRVWLDPFLRPKNPRYPSSFQPLSPLDFPEEEHLVLLTHSHPDHFDPGSLLLFPENTRFLIPRFNQRENLLTFDLKHRLRDLGFKEIRELSWWEGCRAGEFQIHALPFYGEQPLGPSDTCCSLRNHGNTWHLRGPGNRTLMALADSGSDPEGSVLEVARRVRRELGPVNHLFSNHRRWRYFPPQILLSSVPQFLCLIDQADLAVEQQIMLTPEQVGVLGDILGARTLTPYAMGGAPWYSEIGLGTDPFEKNDGRDSFDAHPDDILKIRKIQDPQNVRIESDWTPVLLWPSEALTPAGKIKQWPGFHRPQQRSFKEMPHHLKTAKAPFFISHGPPLSPREIHSLASLLSVLPQPHLVAAGEFLEIGLGPLNERGALSVSYDEFNWSLDRVRNLLRTLGRSWEESHTPASAGALSEGPEFLQSYLQFQRRVFHSLLMQCSDQSLSGCLASLRTHGERAVLLDRQSLIQVSAEYLGLDLVEALNTRHPIRSVLNLGTSRPSDYSRVLKHLPIDPKLPNQTRKRLLEAWLELKCLHASFLTLTQAGHGGLTESLWLKGFFSRDHWT